MGKILNNNNVRFGLIVFILIALAISMINAIPVLAATLGWEIQFTNTSGTAYTNTPLMTSLNTGALVSGGYMQDNGLDAVVMDGTTALPTMVSDNAVWWVGNMPANTTKNFRLTTGNTPVTSMPIIVGQDGFITTPYDARLELGTDWEIDVNGYVDTTAGVDKYILYKQNELELYVDPSTSGIIDLTGYYNSGSSFTLQLTDIPTGYTQIIITEISLSHEICLTFNNLVFSSSTTAWNVVMDNNTNDWIWDKNNVMPYIDSISISLGSGGGAGVRIENYYLTQDPPGLTGNYYNLETSYSGYTVSDIETDSTYYYVSLRDNSDNYSIHKFDLSWNEIGTPLAGHGLWAGYSCINGGYLYTMSYDNKSVEEIDTSSLLVAGNYTHSGDGYASAGTVNSIVTDGSNVFVGLGSMNYTFNGHTEHSCIDKLTMGLLYQAQYSDFWADTGSWSNFINSMTAYEGNLYAFTGSEYVMKFATAGFTYSDSTHMTGDIWQVPISGVMLHDGLNLYIITNTSPHPIITTVNMAILTIGNTWTWNSSSTIIEHITYDSTNSLIWAQLSNSKAVGINTSTMLTTYQIDDYVDGIWLFLTVDNPNTELLLQQEYTPSANTEVLRYQPEAIIQGTTLTDLDGLDDGVITWGNNNSSGNGIGNGNPIGVNPVIGSMFPITQAQITSNTAGLANYVIMPDVSSNFSTTINPSFPGADIITSIANATGTPPQLPFILLSSFTVLALSLTGSYIQHKFLTSSIFIKVAIVTGLMGIFVALKVYDFWMLVLFLIMAITIAFTSVPKISGAP